MRYINFSYSYRDAGNNKKHGIVSFINTGEISLEDIEKNIRSKLIDGVWFVAEEWGFPDLHFECWDRDLDHDWHQFVGVEESDEMLDYLINLKEFFGRLKNINSSGL